MAQEQETVTILLPLDPSRETEKAYAIACMAVWVPKSQVKAIEPSPIDYGDGRVSHVIRIRVKKFLHPRASFAQKAAYRADPWKKDADGNDLLQDVHLMRVTVPKWLADKNNWKIIPPTPSDFQGPAPNADEVIEALPKKDAA